MKYIGNVIWFITSVILRTFYFAGVLPLLIFIIVVEKVFGDASFQWLCDKCGSNKEPVGPFIIFGVVLGIVVVISGFYLTWRWAM